MISKIFAIFDSKLGEYQRPIFAQNQGVLIRDLSSYMKETNCPFNVCPSDFTLYELGEFDTITGKFQPITPNSIMSLDNLSIKEVI